MKFAVGYQQTGDGESFPAIVADYRPHIEEVYFSWPGMASGRGTLGCGRQGRDWSTQARIEEDLAALRELGARLDLLFNANCYGEEALSESLADEVSCVIDHLVDVCEGPDVVTTTSPFVAHVVKTRFPGLETRASVNMRIGTTGAMEAVAQWFDGFYLQRDVQRDPARVRQVYAWCQAHGKKLCLLVNSGCLRYCPGQVFHDNLVAHTDGIDAHRNLEGFDPHVCSNLYRDPERLVAFLKSTWIRPEDLGRYAGIADLFKLATRQHSHPRMVIDAYVKGAFQGNLLNLTEPGFAQSQAPRYIDNTAFPDDWAERMATCGADCGDCRYCEDVLAQTLKRYPEGGGNT